ncbi:MAG: type II toxin-antitoxin system prevent-host-death family antitoxin [Acidimicrobiia bacterium]|nr:type II toxin-antitoxin system prevent-host-death family antitoxin [Acidimicrobiia bacterium]
MSMVAISEIKARLSEYLARVRRGEDLIITDRGRPVARIVPLADVGSHIAELERGGQIRRPTRSLDPAFLTQPRHRLAERESLLEAVLDERREGR